MSKHLQKGIKTIYLRNVLIDLYKAKWKVLFFVILCVFISIGFVLRPGTSVNLTEEQKKTLAEYQDQLAEYDAAIDDLQKSIRENNTQIIEINKYIDNSIYMQINPQKIQTFTVQYGVLTGGNVGNILNSFVAYINDGGLRESVAEEDADLQPEYWKDVVSCYVSSNILNVTVMHYDAEKCARIMEIVKQRIIAHISEVIAVQGDFTLSEIESSQYMKAEAGVLNNQNAHRNNLKNYESGLADLRNRLVSYRTNKANYIKNNEPSFGVADPTENEDAFVQIAKYMLVGVIMGIIISCVTIVLRYILSDRLRSADDLRDSGLNVLGICRIKKGEKGGATLFPEPMRVAMDVAVLTQIQDNTQKNSKVYLDLLHEDEFSRKVVEISRNAFQEAGVTVEYGSCVMDSAEELKKMIKAGKCLLVAESGKTTYQELKKHMELCERFQTVVLGCMVIE